MIDVRSDTVTRPGPAMLEAMHSAEVGDDVLGEDPTVNALQAEAASLFGKEAALFCPSGTMTNQIAIKLHTQPGDEVLCDQLSHVYLYEGGGIAFHSGASVRLLAGERGRFTAAQVRANVNSVADAHYPRSRLVTIENTVNKGGGACWSLDEVRRIRSACDELGLALHLDGARLFNALVARGESPRDYGALFDTISICLSKGLGAPVGSLLLGSREHVARAHRLRKVFGGGMRQAGYLAAAGRFALAHNVARLATDHARAATIGAAVARLPFVAEVLPVETNIVIFRLEEAAEEQALLAHLRSHGVLAATMGRRLVRFVMHLDLAEDDVGALIGAVSSFH
jgi:threonine aldolase